MSSTPGRMGFDFTFGSFSSGAAPRRPDPDAPFRIAVLADFSGRGSRTALDPASIASRRAHRIDIDNLDETIAAMGVSVRVSVPDPVDIRITRLDDFHPDHLFRTLDLFAPLRALRTRLLDPASFDAAAAEVRSLLGASAAAPAASAAAPDAPASTQPQSGLGLLESLLGGKVARPAGESAAPAPTAPAPKGGDIASIVRRMAQSAQAADAVSAPDPQRDTLLAALDAHISERMRAILASPAFQRVEAAWRAVHLLITSIQTDEELTIDLFDVAKAEVAADLQRSAAGGSFDGSSLAKLLLDRSINAPGGTPWSLLVADYTLAFTTVDAAIAAFLAGVGARCGAPFLAAASPAHVGCWSPVITTDPDSWEVRKPSGDEVAPGAWAAVRQTPEAAHLALTLPRFLARHPYGPAGEAVESFGFTEVPDAAADHERFLWASSAYAAAIVIAQAFTDDGADMTLPDAGELTGLPVYIYTHQGEKTAVPCAEAWLTLKASHAVQSAGLTPVLSIKNRDAVRIAAIQSIADPIAPLAGRWS